MKKRELKSVLSVLIVFIFIMLVYCSYVPSIFGQPAPQPDMNVLIILSDELRPDRIHYGGNERIHTPNIDRLAREGAFFSNAFQEMPISGPSRCATITGRFPHSTQMRANGWLLPPYEVTLAEAMQDAGFITGLFFGNFNVGPGTAFEQGFQWQYMVGREARPEPGRDTPLSLDEMLTPKITRLSLEWLADNYDLPFLLWVDYVDPHPPFEAPEKYNDMYLKNFKGSRELQRMNGYIENVPEDQRTLYLALYDAEVTFIDDYVGKILDKMEDYGILDNTLIILFSDHGEMQGENNLWGKGSCLYDPLTRFTLIMRYPSVIPKGKWIDALVQNTDIMPTVLDIAGVPIPPMVQGKSILPLLTGGAEKIHDFVISEFTSGQELKSIRTMEWKYIYNHRGVNRTTRVTGHELYNLKTDTGEEVNLIDKEPEEAERLKNMLIDWMIDSEDRLPGRIERPWGPARARR